MLVQETQKGVLVTDADLNLEKTLDCGQCFRFYQQEDGSWHGVAGNKPLTLRHVENNSVLFLNISQDEFQSFWRHYFDLDKDYKQIMSRYRSNAVLSACADFSPGMRIVRQDAWEALISFILSQNNNVKRIKGIIDRLCRLYGTPCGASGDDYSFPTPELMAGLQEEDLTPLRAGWRAAYIADAAHRVFTGEINLELIAAMPLEDAREALQVIHGVGPKVAECVLLYGMGRMEAFPLDVWMKRAMTQLFPGYTPESFGECAGIVQQYIFHYCRCHPECCRT